MQRLRSSVFSAPNLKKKYLNSWAAIQDTYFSTKDTFERHRVVFTVGTSVASVATAWFGLFLFSFLTSLLFFSLHNDTHTHFSGYSLRHLHETKVDQRLQSIENAMKNNSHLQHSEIKDIVSASGPCSIPACLATAGTSLLIGYGLGWRGGSWYATKKFRKEQMKMLGQITPKRWQLLGKIKPRGLQFQFLRKNLTRSQVSDTAEQNMANTSLSTILVILLFWGLTLATARKLPPLSTTTALSSSLNQGICSSMVKTQGYTCEEHLVTTQDGYILNLPRIVVGESRGPPVLLQHGLFMDGVTWLLLPPNKSLAFLLADNGFDVWVSNTRGTKYSRQHTFLPINSSDYWNWSWDELVAYDLPATFKYVHDLTGQKLHYVGHSQGTLIALAAFSQDQLLNMLRSAALLSPIAFVGDMTSPLAKNAAENFIAEVLNSNGVVLVEFFAPWCGHCKALTPVWEKAATVLKGVVTVAALDADAHQSLAQEYGIRGFPTIKVFVPGKPPVDYQGARDVKPIAEFALQQVKALLKERLNGKATGGSSEKTETSSSVELNSGNFDELVIKSKELWIVEFFAPWCGHCKKLAPEWKKASNNLKGKVKLGHVDCDAEKSLMSRFKVQGFPTILVFGADKDSPIPYEGARTASAIESFALEQLETNVAPPEVSEIHSPDVLEEKCGSAAICFVAFLPDILDSKAEGRNRYLQQLLSVAENYVWVAAGKQPDLEKHVGVGGYGYPALVALNLKKAVYAPLKSAFELDHIIEFVKEAGRGGKGNLPLQGTPGIVKTEPWDGKDGEIIEEDEFSLEELMGEDASSKDEL
ncbi:Protein disulfide isomerase-like 2-3, partial [Mucuna pruriens]